METQVYSQRKQMSNMNRSLQIHSNLLDSDDLIEPKNINANKF